MRTLLINELEQAPKKLIKVVHYDGLPITARFISEQVEEHQQGIAGQKTPLTVAVGKST
jgi:2-oxoglutarate ferredoxin oxidoreductase subunit alpha